MKHTPGPWNTNEALRLRGYRSAVFAQAESIADIPDVSGGPSDGTVALANARLIAAAPDLLAALKTLMGAAGTDDALLVLALTMALAAITKAENER